MKRQPTIWLCLAVVMGTALLAVPPSAYSQGGHHGGDHDPWIEVEGTITALSSNSLTVGSTEIFVNGQTVIEGRRHTRLTFSDLQVGQRVEVKAQRQSDGSLLALRIEVEMHMGQGEIEAKGTLQAKGDSTITVAGLTFQVTAQTMIMGDEHRPLTFADLQVGQRVEVKGLRLPDGTLVALMIKLEDDALHGEIEVEGFIEAVSPTSLTVAGITFAIGPNTVVEGPHHLPMTLGDLAVGQRVEVEGQVQVDGSLLALRIEVKPMLQEQVEVTGLIDAVGTDYVVVLGLKFFVDANTVILDDDHRPITLADLRVGQTVEIKAMRQADGSLLALRIVVEDFRAMQIEVQGNIESIDSGNQTITVQGLTFKVTSETRILAPYHRVLTFDSLQVGMRVEVHGVQEAAGLVATRIVVRQELGLLMEISGTITAIDSTDSTIVVAGITIKVDAHTVILKEHHWLGTFSDLQVGDRVEVKARRQADGSLLAVRLRIDDRLGHGLQMAGLVNAISGNRIVVAGVEFAITPNTVLLDSDYRLISASQVNAGETVYVWGEQQPGQSPSAVQIQQAGGQVTSAGDGKPQTVTTYALRQNYPNPFNPSTTIRFEIPASAGTSDVELTIYNLMGQKIRTLVSAKMSAGSYTVTWDGRDDRGAKAASGIYFYRLQAGSFTTVRRMVLTK